LFAVLYAVLLRSLAAEAHMGSDMHWYGMRGGFGGTGVGAGLTWVIPI